MSRYSSADIGFLLLGPYNLANVSNKLEVSASNPVVDTTPFGVSAAAYGQPGVKRFEITGHDGWYDDTTGSLNTATITLASTENVFMFGYKGNTAGVKAICAAGALQAAFKRSFAVGDFTKASMELGVSGVIEDATIVSALAQVDDSPLDTETADIDLGATGGGTTGGNVYLSCTQLDLSGRPGFTVTFEDSADAITYAPQTAMTALTLIGAEKKASTDQTVNRYVAAAWAWGGAGGTPTATFVLAVSVNAPH